MAKRTQTRFIARMVEGSKPSTMPGFIKPQLATLKKTAPKGDWLHEVKFDGYRAQIHINKGKVTVYTRGGHDWTHRFAPIAAACDIPVERAIFDGEIVVVEDNRTNFSLLQADLAYGRKDRMSFYAFDLLYLEGFDLRGSPLVERKRVLEMLFKETKLVSPVFYSQHFDVDGASMFANACKLKLEGIISKNPGAPYRSDRNEAWLKIKCSQTETFPIVGFIAKTGGIGALYLGRREGKELKYVGKVGTGFNYKTSAVLRRKLDKLVTPKAKLTERIRKPKATWVEPKLSAQVEYRDITTEGYLRHSSFKGLK